MQKLIKGKTSCNRTSCQVELIEGAIYYNHATDANYCPDCAYKINLAMSDLCKLIPPKVFGPEEQAKHQALVEDYEKFIVGLKPEDGFNSPRDIKLVTKINQLTSYLEAIKANTVVKAKPNPVNIALSYASATTPEELWKVHQSHHPKLILDKAKFLSFAISDKEDRQSLVAMFYKPGITSVSLNDLLNNMNYIPKCTIINHKDFKAELDSNDQVLELEEFRHYEVIWKEEK